MLYRSRTRSVWGQVAFAFIIGGTIGNAIDRLFLAERVFFTGEVRDFVMVKHFFGIFNMADSFLVVGVILALLAIGFFDYDSLLSIFLEERKKKKNLERTNSEQTDNGFDSKIDVDVHSEKESARNAESTINDENNQVDK